MKKAFTLIAVLMPVSAFAHGPASAYFLLWWYLALVIFVIGFAIFGTCTRKRKLYSIGGLVLLTVLAWSTLGNIHSNINAWQSDVIAVVLGLIPVVGFVLGLFLGRAKKNAI